MWCGRRLRRSEELCTGSGDGAAARQDGVLVRAGGGAGSDDRAGTEARRDCGCGAVGDCEDRKSYAQAQAMGQPRGKTECWYVLEAAPGATIALGLKPGATVDVVRSAIAKIGRAMHRRRRWGSRAARRSAGTCWRRRRERRSRWD